MPLVAAVPPAPTDLAWRVIGLVNLYRLLIPPALLRAASVLRRIRRPSATPTRSCSSGPAWCISPRASPSSSAAGACCPTCGQPPSSMPWWTPWPSACCCSRAAASPAASAFCSWCRWAPWRCSPTAAMHSCWRPSPPWRCSRSRSAATCYGHAADVTTTRRGHPGRHRVPGGAARLADRARLRDTEATVRRQQVDLANLAQLSQYIVQNLRESIVVVDHENRIRLINESAAHAARRSQRLSGRAARRSLAAAALSTRNLAAAHRHARRCLRRPSSPPTAAT